MHKKVFIGSSSEACKYLQRIKEKLENNNFEVIGWNDQGVFSLNNKSYLDSLIKQSYLVDFAIFIATGDDKTISRRKKESSPRDNVIFEFGLFLNALGKERCFLLMEDKCKILSDMHGITLLKFNKNNFEREIKRLIGNLQQRKKNIPSLITTGLAYGYYKNFIKKLHYSKIEKVHIFLLKENFCENNYDKCNDLGGRQVFYEKLNNQIEVFDYPTTLNVIEDILNDKAELSEHDKEEYRKRELTNFKTVLEKLMESEKFKEKIIFKT